MKATYIKPETIIVMIHQERSLLAGSDIPTGDTYKSGDAVLSREGGSSWDDEE